MRNTGTWKVVTATVDELEERLNTLEQEGYEVFTIMPLGLPAPQASVPRDQRTLEQRSTFMITARKPQP